MKQSLALTSMYDIDGQPQTPRMYSMYIRIDRRTQFPSSTSSVGECYHFIPQDRRTIPHTHDQATIENALVDQIMSHPQGKPACWPPS